MVTVEATSGTGERVKTATQTITVTVTDVAGEAPGKPAAPAVAAASVTSLTVSWSAPSNAGPAITDYDVQYRAGTSGGWTDGTHTGTATTATLTGLSENTSYQVQVRATNDEGTGAWSDAGSGTTDANAAPAFSSDDAFDAAENETAAGTVLATDSDADDSITGYAITGGADQALFEIDASTGELTFKSAPNYEDPQDSGTDNGYVVTVEATSGTGERVKTATQTITVTVTDVAGEAPGKPAAPAVAAASVTSLTVSWSAPSNAGPAITDYDVQYRAGTSGGWTDGTHTGTATTATLTGLSENTSYQVQVRATNDEGTGAWSDAGSGTTDANAAPAFSSDDAFDAAENETAAGTVLATDSDADDDITGYAITGGADQALFEIDASTGELTFKSAPNFEDPQDSGTDNGYVVTVEATSGTGERVKTATQTITVTVTDVAGEAPGKPAAPAVAAASVTSLTVSWSAPSNAGPAITDYDVQYRAGTSGGWTDGTHTGTATTATLTGLSENTSYQVQVRATNDEGTGAWSDAGSGTTDANAAPAFSSDDAFDAAENETAAGTVLAADSDADDSITGYAITGGADQALFEIDASTGELTFKSAPNFEDPQDSGTDNGYVVTVEATSGAGERVKTATQTITVTVTDVAGEAPGKPVAPAVAAASVTSLTVSWSAPSNAGPAITDYDVQYRAGTSGGWTDGTHTGTATTATLTGLSENTSYQVQVRATNDEGTGAWSDSGSGTTDANAAPAPEAPQAEGQAGSYTSLVVSWTAPDTGDGAAITGYEIRYREHPGGEWESWPHDGTGAAATITELEVNTAYEVQVRALYGEMQSAWVRVPGQVRTAAPPAARVRNVGVVNGPGSDGVWSAGERVELEVVYPEPMVVEKPEDCWSYNADGTCKPSGPFVLVVFRDDARPGYGTSLSTPLAPYVGGSGTTTLRFAYTVGEDEDGARRVEPADNGILLRGATIRTLEGGESEPVYTNTRVRQVDVLKPGGGAWTAGGRVRVAVKFTGPAPYTPPAEPQNLDEVVVDETGGAPTIDLLLGDRVNRDLARTATYVSGSGKDTLVFEYGVAAGDGRVGAVEVVADSLAKNGATIRNKQGYDAELEHLGAVQYAQRAALSVADAEATEGEDATLDFVVKLDGVPGESDVTVDYRTQDGEAEAGSDYTETRGTLRFARGEGVYEKTVRVPIVDDDVEDGGETFKLLLSNVTGAAVANYEAVGTIRNDETPPRPELTAEFEGMPAAHDGESAFTLRIASSDRLSMMNGRRLREDVVAVSGGRATSAGRVDRRRDLWRLTVEPDSPADVTVTVAAGAACGTPAAVCTKDGRALSNTISATVAGPVGISVADARVEEGDGALLAFVVTLSRAADGTVTVDYATADGSARAGVDYRAASGTLTFRAGESSKTVEVAALDDSHDEGEETLTLRLSNASGARVTDGEATGTINNSDPLPRALLARFGRTAAVQVVEQVEQRLEASREPGFRGRVAGRELRRGMERDIAMGLIRRLGGAAGVGRGVGGAGSMGGAAGAAGFAPPGRGDRRRSAPPALPMRGAASMGAGPTGGAAGSLGAGSTRGAAGGATGMAGPMGGAAGSMGMAGPMGGAAGSMGMATRRMGGADAGGGWLNGRGLLEMGLGGGDVLTGSAFTLNRETRRGGALSLWSRGARSRYSGREGALSLGGDVSTTMFGADYARGPLVVGLSLSNTRGLGEYRGPGAGRMLSSVTGLYPWLGYRATDRITVWGVTGYGVGGMLLTPGSGPALESGLSTAMAAAGTRGELVGGGGNGFALAFKADALWAGTGIDGVDGPEGRLVATSAAVTRVRTGLEGSRGFTLGGGLSLRPSVEVGLRHDGGDAETGAGVDVGGGLVASHPSSGLAVDVRVRTLLVHEAEGFSERGVSLSLSWNPTPSTPLGLTARLAPSWGGQATSGADALWGRDTMAGLVGTRGGLAPGNRLDAELGYGLPVGSRFVGTPRFGLRTSETGRDYRLGYGLGLLNRGGVTFELGVEAQRRNSPVLRGTSTGVLGRVTLGW